MSRTAAHTRMPQDVQFARELVAAACAAMGIELSDVMNPHSNRHQGAFYKLRRLAWWLANGRGRNDGASLRSIAAATDYSYAPVKRGVELLARFPGPAHSSVRRLVEAFRAAVDGRDYEPVPLSECVEAFDVLSDCKDWTPSGSPPVPASMAAPVPLTAEDERVLAEWRALLARLQAGGIVRKPEELIELIRRSAA